MRRTASILGLLAILALAPAAAAKGPHASIASGPEGLRPGEPWVTTLTLVELGGRELSAARPYVILRSRLGRFRTSARPLDIYVPPDTRQFAEARYRLRVVFPRAGRWTYTVVDGTRASRRFRFPAATIGGGAERVTTGHVAFAQGSRAEAEGGAGPIVDAVPEDPPGGDTLPPEVVLPPEAEKDGGGTTLWLPAAGLALAGAGTLTLLRRRRR